MTTEDQIKVLREARDAFESAIKINPNNIETYQNFIKMLFDQNQFKEAYKIIKLCRENNPEG